LIGLIIWALFVTAGYYVGKQKGRAASWTVQVPARRNPEIPGQRRLTRH
jgi:hypothetical protein